MRNMKKRLLSTLLALLLLLSIAPVSAGAAAAQGQPMTVRVSEVQALAGATVTVTVSLENNPGLASFKARVAYDSSIVTLQQVEYNPGLGGQSIQPQSLTSPVTLTWVNPFGECTLDTVFATLTFAISETAADGDVSPIVLTANPNDIYDGDENNISVNIVNGAVRVLECVPGDINKDGDTNNKDLTRMFQYLANWNVEVNEPVILDTNGDGNINNKDLTRLFQYLADWDVDLHPDPIPRCRHDLVYHARIEPSCTVTGQKEYWRCSICGKYYGDVNASSEVTPDSLILPPAHTEEIIPATSTMSEGKRCSVCGTILVEPRPIGSGEYTIQFQAGMIDNFDPVEVAKVQNSTYRYGEAKALPTLRMDRYTFIGWSDQYGNFYQDPGVIPAGTAGDLILRDHWISQRNQAKAKLTLDDPLVLEDLDNHMVLFCYEIGTIEHVPLFTIETLNSVNGMITVHRHTDERTLTATDFSTIGTAVSRETTQSTQFELSEALTEQTQVSEEYLRTSGKDRTVAEEEARSQSTTHSVSNSSGGSSEQYLYNDVTKRDATNENYVLNTNLDTGVSNELTMGVKNTTTVEAGVKFPIDILSVNAGVKNTTEFSVQDTLKTYMDYSVGSTSTWNHDTFNESHSASSTTNSRTWNSTNAYSTAATVSNSTSISEALHEMVSNNYHYGESYSVSQVGTEAHGHASTQGATTDERHSIEFTKQAIQVDTVEYQTTGKTFGNYRLVMAGTMHVFAVVGYDIASGDYFVYTFNVMGDGSRNDGWYEYMDYSYDNTFTDHENSVIPFAVPKYVNDYVNSRLVYTEGLEYIYNNRTHTATVSNYTGTDTVVYVPSYTVDAQGTAFRVTGITSGAFSGKAALEAVSLGRFVSAIPDSAFEDCSSLEYVICPAVTSIGSRAFYNCTSLHEFKISRQVDALGENAFFNVPSLIAEVSYDKDHPEITKELAENAAASGALMIKLDLSDVYDPDEQHPGEKKPVSFPLALNVGSNTSKFTLKGGGNPFTALSLVSHSATTSLEQLHLLTPVGIPLVLYSDRVELYAVDVENCAAYVMTLRGANPTVLHLSGTNTFETSNDTAIVSKGINVTYGNSGALHMYGSIKHCGEIGGSSDRILFSSGQYISIAEDVYNSIVDGAYTLTFDSNGGSEPSPASIQVYTGQAVGTLPTVSKQGHTFDGWYLEDGSLVTPDTIYPGGTHVLTAQWTPNTFTLTLNANGGTCSTASKAVTYGTAVGALPIPTRANFQFAGWFLSSGVELTESMVFPGDSDQTATAVWLPDVYTVSWNNGTGYTINVSRTNSPYENASTGALSSGAAVYYGDVLSVSYTPATGYSIDQHGETSIVVAGNTVSDAIYATASANPYTYYINYVSVNGTVLGSETATFPYGALITISPLAYSGYTAPDAQTVAWDSTSAKTITFTYTPISASNATKTGTISTAPKLTYSAVVEYQNRTATSVQLRVRWTTTIGASGYTVYGQNFKATVGNTDTGKVQVAAFNTWKNSSSSNRSSTGTSGWITVPLNTTNATTVSMSIYYWQTNSNGTDMHAYNGTDAVNTTWTINIPAY